MAASENLRWRDTTGTYTSRTLYLVNGTTSTQAGDGATALRAITNGANAGAAYCPTDTTGTPVAPPALSTGAESSLQWICNCTDIVTGGVYTFKLPTAAVVGASYTKIVGGRIIVDPASAEYTAIQTFVDTYVINNSTGNKVVLGDIVYNQS